MKKIITIILVCAFSFSLNAVWNVGSIVDDFGDPTGDQFVYTVVNGTFSNSATANSASKIRVSATFEAYPFPSEKWDFEIHEYGFDNPVNTFYSSSKAEIKVKDLNGKVYTYNTDNNKFENRWNKLRGTNAQELSSLIVSNPELKFAISCESTRYNFTVTTEGAKALLEDVRNSIQPNLKKWVRKDIDSVIMPFYEELIANYRRIGISKTFPVYELHYYDLINIDGKQVLIDLHVDDEDLSKNGYASVGLYTNILSDDNSQKSSYGDITQVTFTINGKNFTLINKEPKTILNLKNPELFKSITSNLASSKSVNIKVDYKDKKSISFPIDGKLMYTAIQSL